MNKFEVNKYYSASGLYGNILKIKIVDRDDIIVKYEYADNIGKCYFATIVLQNGIESIKAWEYDEHKGYWYAVEQ